MSTNVGIAHNTSSQAVQQHHGNWVGAGAAHLSRQREFEDASDPQSDELVESTVEGIVLVLGGNSNYLINLNEPEPERYDVVIPQNSEIWEEIKIES